MLGLGDKPDIGLVALRRLGPAPRDEADLAATSIGQGGCWSHAGHGDGRRGADTGTCAHRGCSDVANEVASVMHRIAGPSAARAALRDLHEMMARVASGTRGRPGPAGRHLRQRPGPPVRDDHSR